MGWHITAYDRSGTQIITTFHYPQSDKNKPLYNVLGVGYLKDNTELKRIYSKGNLLEAKSKLLDIKNTLPEIDFINSLLVEILINPNPITIKFN